MKVIKLLLNGTAAYYFIPILIVMSSLQIVIAESKGINEKLWDAVDVEDESLVKQLLEQGADGGAVVDRGGFQIENLTFNKGDLSIEYMYSADTALKQAVNKGSSALVRLLLEAGVEDEDNAAFIHAVRSLHTDVVRDFLHTRSDNMHDWDSPIVCDSKSCRSRYQGQLGEQLMRLLVANYGNIELRSLFAQVGLEVDTKGLSPEEANQLLVSSINEGDPELTAKALSIGADPNHQDNKGFPMLPAAVATNAPLEVVAAILNAGADVNFKMQSAKLREIKGYTSLHLAVGKGNEDIVKLLLDGGADVDAVTDDEFQSKAPKATPLMLAVNAENPAMVRMLVDAGADVNFKMQSVKLREIKGYTSLHFAVGKGNEDIVKLLLDGGADVDAVTDDEFQSKAPKATPLMLAVNAENPAMVRMLVDAGADVNFKMQSAKLREIKGYTSLHFAVGKGNEAIVKLLLDGGADVDAVTDDEFQSKAPKATPLMLAVNAENPAMVRMLVDAGADVNFKMQSAKLREIKGYTSLHFAVGKGNEAIVKLLLDGGADVDAVTDDEFQSKAPKATSLLLAANAGNLEIVKMLIHAGANVNYEITDARKFNGATALGVSKSEDVTKILKQAGANK